MTEDNVRAAAKLMLNLIRATRKLGGTKKECVQVAAAMIASGITAGEENHD